MAQSGHANDAEQCPLSGAKRTCPKYGVMSAYDPKRTTAIRHSITSSACASSMGGMSNPIALAVLRLITSSKAVGCSTGS
jgi:hypothetical protein